MVITVKTRRSIPTTHYSTAQRHCPLTRRSELARALIVNIIYRVHNSEYNYCYISTIIIFSEYNVFFWLVLLTLVLLIN